MLFDPAVVVIRNRPANSKGYLFRGVSVRGRTRLGVHDALEI